MYYCMRLMTWLLSSWMMRPRPEAGNKGVVVCTMDAFLPIDSLGIITSGRGQASKFRCILRCPCWVVTQLSAYPFDSCLFISMP